MSSFSPSVVRVLPLVCLELLHIGDARPVVMTSENSEHPVEMTHRMSTAGVDHGRHPLPDVLSSQILASM